MTQKLRMTRQPDARTPVAVTMAEWQRVGPRDDARLRGLRLGGDVSERMQVEALRERVDIRNGYDGLEITTTSFVGRVDVGPLRLAIEPKLPAMPLTRLLRYAYGLRDIDRTPETRSPTQQHGLLDILAELLAAESEELLHRGLACHYVPFAEARENPRGRILFAQLARQGGLRDARLPCRHVERRADWHLNQVLQAGLVAAAGFIQDAQLRRRLHRIADGFGQPAAIRLTTHDIDRAQRELTRLTDAYAPALTLVRLLHTQQGIAVEAGIPQRATPGFLFDMNLFFQRLVSRFLHEHLHAARIDDERAIRGLFAYPLDASGRYRRAPSPRPDYALFRNGALQGFLDAKYRDLARTSLPAAWLYQLSIYALASPSRSSVLLYASMAPQARDERIEIRQPVAWPGQPATGVIVRPVPLLRLAELLDPGHARQHAGARRELAGDLVAAMNRLPAA